MWLKSARVDVNALKCSYSWALNTELSLQVRYAVSDGSSTRSAKRCPPLFGRSANKGRFQYYMYGKTKKTFIGCARVPNL